MPAREPDFTFTEATTPEQATIYRLSGSYPLALSLSRTTALLTMMGKKSGDWNPLHIDPAIGKKIGFPGVILHGLCSYGHAARAISLTAGAGDASTLTFMSGRFTSPVIPGNTFVTKIWVSATEDGGKRIDFEQNVKETGKICLGGGVALLKKKSGATKL